MSAAAGAIVEAPLMLNSQPTNWVRLIAERLLEIIFDGAYGNSKDKLPASP
jgi:hypothetical protein